MNKQLSLSRAQARQLDEITMAQYGIPGIVLMENAGRGIFEHFLTYQPTGKIIICCGKGNNGGDGFVLARYLVNADFSVEVLLFASPGELQGDAKTNYDIAMKMGIPMRVIDEANMQAIAPVLSDGNWIVDALFGTGLQGGVQAPFDEVIELINAASQKVLAIDIPSGLDCDTGEVLGVAVQATVTTSMVGFKKGFSYPKAKAYLGDVHVVDIGVPSVLIENS